MCGYARRLRFFGYRLCEKGALFFLLFAFCREGIKGNDQDGHQQTVELRRIRK
jgi:hypothetical protein